MALLTLAIVKVEGTQASEGVGDDGEIGVGDGKGARHRLG